MAMSWNPIPEWDNERWREQAACRYTDANLFFPTGSTGVAIDQIKTAKLVCESCPVADACLEFALKTNQEAGIWGGKDEDERRRLRKVWRKTRQPAPQWRTA